MRVAQTKIVTEITHDLDKSCFNGAMGAKLDWGEFKRESEEANRRLNN